MKIPDLNEFMDMIEKIAKENDRKISPEEENILNELAKMKGKPNRKNMYRVVLKTIYKDGYLDKDEAEIILAARKILNIKLHEHQEILNELGFI